MLIQRAPDVYEKLQHLGGMASDDILAPPSKLDSAAPRPDWHGNRGLGAASRLMRGCTGPPCPTGSASR